MHKSTATRRVDAPAASPLANGILQRQCACATQTASAGECAQCAKRRGSLQRKLAIGASNDPLEREADQLADRIVAAPPNCASATAPAQLQRSTAQAGGGADAAPASVERVLAGSGRALEPVVQQDMAQRFGHDFSHVRVHSGIDAAQSAREVDALAYTAGHHIAFAAGRFAPHTNEGRRLLAHELTHVVQQSGAGGAPPLVQRDTAGGGSTEFKDTVRTLHQPASGPGIVEGTVERRETAPASGARPAEVISWGRMAIRFDPSDCSVTIPLSYKFVQAATGPDDPPAATAVPPLAANAFNRIKTDTLAAVNSGLNGWFNVRLAGAKCPAGCGDRPLPIRVVAREDSAHPDVTITVVNRAGRADSGTIYAKSWDKSTAVHEGGHQVLGLGDEYLETDERLRAVSPQWFRPERVRRDYSAMGPGQHSRFAMFHERHFNGVKVFLEQAFPGCVATLSAQARPVMLDFRFTVGAGHATLSGIAGGYFSLGLGIGIPLDRLRRWEFMLGPQFNTIWASGPPFVSAFLLGARLGLEGSTGAAGHGLTAGAFGEVGHGWFSSSGASPGGTSAKSAYGELGASAGYRTPLLEDSMRFDIRVEGALGTTLGAAGVIGMPPDIAADPARSRWFRLGLVLGTQF